MGSSDEEKLMQMVQDFIESETATPISHAAFSPIPLCHNPMHVSLKAILERVSDAESEILGKILLYLNDMEAMGETNNVMKRWIVSRLKMDGHEACLCTTSWISIFGPPSAARRVTQLPFPKILYDVMVLFSFIYQSNAYISCFQALEFKDGYEYIDVMMKDEGDGTNEATRLIIDMDFRSQFEIARATPLYAELKNALPSIFVGTEGKLNKIISLLCTAAKQSLRESGLLIAPWRKASYMRSKWLSENCRKISVSPTREAAGIVKP
ncbi:hypothetical protein RJ639_038551 [Escallonia herrerae]|uniref:Uncharacterized protein n=1 Tax=Escallonia herrerae TaxID=1293975 RepID=A0AA88WJ92_9ASTE|nr:hypothetical protein RJ639_038551 [Escallonia herrerae]